MGVDDTLVYYGSRTNHPVTFSTNTFERMRITSGGDVGIGTTSPARPLTIRSAQAIATATTYTGAFLIHDEPSGTSPHLGMGVAYNGGNEHSWIQSNNTSGVFSLALNPAGGNVGIGTTSPSFILQTKASSGFVGAAFSSSFASTAIIGTDNTGIWFGQGTNGLGAAYVINNTNGFAQIELGGAPRFFVNSSGNVGIGTTSPNNLLQLTAAAGSSHARWTEAATTVGFIGGANGIISGLNGSFAVRGESGLVLSGAGNSATMFLNPSGNVGIGTISPVQKLHVEGSTAIGTTGTEDILILGRALGGGVSFQQAASLKLGRYQNAGVDFESYTRLDFALRDNSPASNYNTNTTVMTLTNAGNVGIGTTSPTSMLTLNGTSPFIRIERSGVNTWQIQNNYLSTTNGFSINNISTSTTPFFIAEAGNVGIGTTSPVTKLDVQLASNKHILFSNGNGQPEILATTDGGAAYTPLYLSGSIVALNPTSGGNVLIGTTTDAGQKLQVNGTGRFSSHVTGTCTASFNGDGFRAIASTTGAGGSQPGIGYWTAAGSKRFINQLDVSGDTWSVTGATGINYLLIAQSGAATFSSTVTATGFFQSSDERLKDIISRNGDVITYKWKDGRDDKNHIGYSAQEVQKVMPDAVNESEDGMLSVNYIEVLVKKMAEMEKEIAYLKSKL
jgi:hypothetical protein